jgi:hypothetical protein
MKGDGKPVSFIEDCAVPLEHLAEYTDASREVFEKHGTRAPGTRTPRSAACTCARARHAEDGAQKMRAIAEEACALVREYKGAYSGEHGDGLVRSEWIAPIFGPRLTAAFGEIKDVVRSAGAAEPRARSCARRAWTTARCSASSRATRAEARRRARLERVGRLRGRWRCATTTATAASSTPAPCARRTARPATSAPHARPRQHAAPGALGQLGASASTRRCARRSTCACRARAASANARPASTWRA